MNNAFKGGMAACLLALMPATAQETVGPELPALQEETVEALDSLQALKLVQDYMGSVSSMKGSFVQRAGPGNMTRGTLYMARPGKIRFDYDDDVPFLVVADGKTINFVDYEIGQVQKWPVKDTPLLAVIGEGFDLASVNAHIEVAPQGREELVALTASDPDRPEMGEITVFFERTPALEQALMLIGWRVIDGQGQITMVDVFDQEVNLDLAPSLWMFEDPRGVSKRRRTRR